MGRRKKRANGQRDAPAGNTPATPKTPLGLWLGGGDILPAGYTRLSENPEIQTACLRIAELIGSMTIHLMESSEDGDRRVVNALSRVVDIEPCGTMTRSTWMTSVVLTMLLYGRGNCVCIPHTYQGFLRSIEPVSACRVGFMPVGNSYRDYKVLIDGQPRDPGDLLHFVYNPDPVYPWKGQGVTVALREIADNLKQARATEKAFMASKWKPSLIVRVDSTSSSMETKEGRAEIVDAYISNDDAGKPWVIPAELMEVQSVKPLSLSDLAVNDTVTLDKKTVAAVVGIPAFMLGVGEFNREEYNNWIQSRIRAIALNIQQELTRALLISPNLYFRFNSRSLLNYDPKTTSDILLAGSDRGFVSGDEWRENINLPPAGLKEYRILENYIPADMSGQQKKLIQGGEDSEE